MEEDNNTKLINEIDIVDTSNTKKLEINRQYQPQNNVRHELIMKKPQS